MFGRKTSGPGYQRYATTMDWDGLKVAPFPNGELSDPLLPGFLQQLVDEGLADSCGDQVVVPWDGLYSALDSVEYVGLALAFGLPRETQRSMVLRSDGSLADADFSIAVAGWRAAGGPVRVIPLVGPVLQLTDGPELMRAAQWSVVRDIRQFAARGAENHNDAAHRAAWARIRQGALVAGAEVDDFLRRTIVLSPERLEIRLRRSEHVNDDHVIEVDPAFAGAPDGWLAKFDAAQRVQDRYDLVTEEGIVQVLVTPQVRTVLEEIKRFPMRRVAGSRAQAFILNPYATLGEDARNVIVEEQFEEAREAAGLDYDRFRPLVDRDDHGYPHRVALFIEAVSKAGEGSAEEVPLDDGGLDRFVRDLESAIAKQFQLLGWNGYDLALDGDAEQHLEMLRQVREQRRLPPILIHFDSVHDLSGYSSRIAGVGFEKPYVSPFIAKKDDEEGWFPENVVPGVLYTPPGSDRPLTIPLTTGQLKALVEAIAKAIERGDGTVLVPGIDDPIDVPTAQALVQSLQGALGAVQSGDFDPPPQPEDIILPGGDAPPAPDAPRRAKSLLLRSNIAEVDYEERREALKPVDGATRLPASLKEGVNLLPHQHAGLGWLQHLHAQRHAHQVRGALLADDMGLGKTIQLLAFMASLIETDAVSHPMLVVAPVSLLENWREEIQKFFVPGALPVMTAYGATLADLRVPRAQIDERLRTEDGLVNFLRPGWVGDARIVLTTYETLRDLEFSFAAQHWSVMVCDEAQRIKNPAAMMTRAAKKQRADFRIACTGTPVENTLADLWCLFDFIQPGLLGALNEFGRKYRRPIEARTDEEKERVEELRRRIEPQTLRRTKADVAKDLPEKLIDQGCRGLQISTTQRNLYSNAVRAYKQSRSPGAAPGAFTHHLELLHYLRLLCTAPSPPGCTVFQPAPVAQYQQEAPKFDWLVRQLASVRERNEKAIVFCEFKQLQRLLQHYIHAVFGVRADIINGDTSADAQHANSRQKRIHAFQAKEGFGVIILSPVAVGFGVNIQAANHVIHYTRTWNPAKEDQATDRAYRIGQRLPVTVYCPIVSAPDFTTVDVKLDRLLELKRELAKDMLNGAGDVDGSIDLPDVVPGDEAHGLEQEITADLLGRLEWRHFEGMVAVLWAKQGFGTCYCTPVSGDNGVDIVAIADANGVLIQTKTSSRVDARLGWETVKDVVGGHAFYSGQHPGVTFGKVGVTNQYFNDNAVEQARLNSVDLYDRTRLADLLQRFPVTLTEVERVLAARK
ncbi:hypothetical protein GCM10027431_16740 [Lysobacter rhizosphaerae]